MAEGDMTPRRPRARRAAVRATVIRELLLAASLLVAASLLGCTSESRLARAPSPGLSAGADARTGAILRRSARALPGREGAAWTPRSPRIATLTLSAAAGASILGAAGRPPSVLVQDKQAPAETDATSGATSSADAVSGATSAEGGDEGPKDAEYCLKCHGPFSKVAERTKDFVTEWGEKANPHVYIPHASTKIADCTECHDQHKIPFDSSETQRKPDVKFCYSCHHTEELVTCKNCHKD